MSQIIRLGIKTLQESANHPQKTNESYDNQTTQPTASKEQTQYENPTYEHARATYIQEIDGIKLYRKRK
jgi:hypothetical protein